jgi:hypothetical protein
MLERTVQQITFAWFPESESLSHALRQLGSYSAAAEEFLKHLGQPVLIAFLMIPILLALAGRSALSTAATLVFSALALVLLTEAADIRVVGSLLAAAAPFFIGVFAIRFHWKQRRAQDDMADLKARIGRLESGEERRWLSKIKSVDQDKGV